MPQRIFIWTSAVLLALSAALVMAENSVRVSSLERGLGPSVETTPLQSL